MVEGLDRGRPRDLASGSRLQCVIVDCEPGLPLQFSPMHFFVLDIVISCYQIYCFAASRSTVLPLPPIAKYC